MRFLSLVAALALGTHALVAQTSDSTQLNVAKRRLDSLALVVVPAVAKQCTFSVQGFFKPACPVNGALVKGAQSAIDSALTLSRKQVDEFILPASSPIKGNATDGTDVGADILKIKAAIAGVVRP